MLSLQAETITRAAEAEFAHRKIFHDGNGEFAIVKLRLEPLPRGAGIEYSAAGQSLPKEIADGLEEGVYEALKNGILNGGVVVDVKVTVMDAKYHEIDSNRKT